jgi:hypothetical protein
MIDPSGGQSPGSPDTTSVPSADALADAAKAMAEVAKNEESRFSNLNTRGVAIISATSLVTALSGIFAKELLGTSLTGWGLTVGLLGLAVTLLTLVIATAIVAFGVLAPKHRAAFGGNDLTDDPSAVTSATDVFRLQFIDYRQIARSLLERNTEKARALEKAYLALFTAVLSASLTVGGILAWRLEQTGTWPF